MSRLLDLYEKNRTLTLIVALAAVMFYTFRQSFPVDDAFISFRYAHNLVSGNGLVWNPGERVEGYSNFLWTLLMALGMLLNFPPERFCIILAIPIQLACSLLTYRLAVRTLKDTGWGVMVMLLAGLNHSVAGFATSGLETSLQLLGFLAAANIFIAAQERGWSLGRTLGLSLILNIAMLTRPDGVVLAGAAIVGWFYTARKPKFTSLATLIFPFVLILFPYLIWKYSYYGDLLPNSFHAKVRDLMGLFSGAYYIYLFSVYYMLLPYLALVVWQGRSLWREQRSVGYLALFTLIWFGYVVSVGGDFMEFRFLAPIVPLLMIAVVAALRRAVARPFAVAALIVALLLGTFNNMFGFGRLFYSYGIERLDGLTDHLYGVDENWISIGKRLKELFGETGIVMSCGASGAIPYYSELTTVDFMGLTDREIAMNGDSFSNMPGHRVISTLDYLCRRNVNIIVEPISFMVSESDLPGWIRAAGWSYIDRFFLDLDKPAGGRMVDEAELIGIPIEKGFTLFVWYLTPDPRVDRIIRERGLLRLRIPRR
jgi:hypothetical protein